MEMVPDSGGPETSRDELVARLQLMETMVADGRRATAGMAGSLCCGGWWILLDFFWQSAKPNWFGPWPIVLGVELSCRLWVCGFFLPVQTDRSPSRTGR